MARDRGRAWPRRGGGLLRLDGRAERRSRPDAARRRVRAPILALQAGDDANILPEHNTAFEEALTAAGVDHEVVVYDGAPHSFFDRRQADYAEQSADAWERTLAFIERHTPR